MPKFTIIKQMETNIPQTENASAEQEKIKKIPNVKFVYQNPMCLIPCATGFCSFIFVIGLFVFLMIFGYFSKH
ncbi:hypothetical protein GF391_03990 [Candidatus Uhrbacteria bacterium]|nr:hypothetical protein [Candidatus Uhrbacteria bacterium]